MGPTAVLWISEQPELPGDWPHHPAVWNLEFRNPEEALPGLDSVEYAAIILAPPFDRWGVDDLLQEVQCKAPGTPVLVQDANISASEAVRLAHSGVYQILTSGLQAFDVIEQAIEAARSRQLANLSAGLAGMEWARLLVGGSREMRQLLHIIHLVAGRRATVLITGETGTGKELAARALHLGGKWRSGPMVSVNCHALPESLLESELFGHVRGAFTGAFQNRIGRFEQAQGGTLFLDEIGELPIELQAKLLRVLQEREFQRLGSSETVKVDIRVVAATNCDLPRRIEDGKFREDLYYRLNVVPLEMPPLRNRRDDIPMLAAAFRREVLQSGIGPAKDADPRSAGSIVRVLLARQCAPIGERNRDGDRTQRGPQNPHAGGFPVAGAASPARVRKPGTACAGTGLRARLRTDPGRDRTQHS